MPNRKRQINEPADALAAGGGAGAGSRTGCWQDRIWLISALLIAATFVAYLPVWRAGFIWDDDTFLWRNPLIQSPDGLWRLWFTTAAPDYFPLTSTTLWLEWRLWGSNPLGYHMVNVLLHAVSAVLLWRVLARLRVPGALLAAAIFAVHPVNVESVAWITERKNTLTMLFYMLSLLLYLRSEDGTVHGPQPTVHSRWTVDCGLWTVDFFHSPSSLLYALSLLALACALLSKSAVAPLPIMLLGLAWWRRGKLTLRDVWRSLPFFGLAACSGLVSLWFQYHRAIGASLLDVRNDSLWSRLAGAGWAFWFYLYKALLPLHLSFVYPRWQIDPARLWSYVPTVLVIVLFLVCWWSRRGWGKAPLLGLGYFGLMLLPILGFVNIYFMRYSLVADHWQYFAIIGPIALAAAGIASTGRWRAWLGPGIGGVLVLALGVLTWRETLAYRDLKSLWTATVARNPSAGLAQNNLGTLLLAEGKVNEAIAHLQAAAALEPHSADVRGNLGSALLQRGLVEEAIQQLRQAIEIQPDSALAHNNLGNALSQLGRSDEAILHLQKAVEIQPALASARCNLADVLLQAGRVDEAIAQLQRALELQPDLSGAYVTLGNALLAKGQVDEAVARFRRAVELQPGEASTHYNLAGGLLRQGRADEALAQYQQAIAMQPGFAPAYNGMANALVQQGRGDAALAYYQKALSLDFRLAEAHLNLANLLLQRGDADQAIVDFEAALQLQPNLPAAHCNLANALLSKGRVDEAIAHFRQALSLQPRLAEAHNGLANALLQKRRVAEAVTHYQAAVDSMPGNPFLLNNLAWVLATCPDASIRDGARAVRLAQEAVQVTHGQNAQLLGTLAAAQAEAGQLTQAVATTRQALDLANLRTNVAQAETLRSRLKLYESGSPFRDNGLTPNR